MKTRQSIYSYFKEPFAPKVKEATCRGINENCAAWVKANLIPGNDALHRYDTVGQPLAFLDDSESESGPTWVAKHLIFKNTTAAMTVQARSLISGPNFPVPEARGMLYCKLISPAKVLEWMLVDGLKKNLYWIPNTIPDEEDLTQSLQSEFDDLSQMHENIIQ